MVTFVDQVTLHLSAGNGGDGCTSTKREKFKPLAGPDGANGGDGGTISLISDVNTTTLLDYHHRPHRTGLNGTAGAGDYRNGAHGGDIVLSSEYVFRASVRKTMRVKKSECLQILLQR